MQWIAIGSLLALIIGGFTLVIMLMLRQEDRVNRRFDKVEKGFDKVEKRFDKMEIEQREQRKLLLQILQKR